MYDSDATVARRSFLLPSGLRQWIVLFFAKTDAEREVAARKGTAAVKTCVRCGVALTPGLGGDPRRLALLADNGHMTTVDLCGEHYREATHAALEALLGKSPDQEPTRV